MNRICKHLLLAGSSLLLGSAVASAQYLGFNAVGDYGMKSGSQPAPGVYVLSPTLYQARYDGLRNAKGDSVAANINIDMSFLVTGAQVTTEKKFLGATYGFQVLPMFINNRFTFPKPDVEKSAGYGWGDMYFQPVNLGWRTKRADFMTAYGIWAPSGTKGHTLNFWGHEIAGGTTVYLDPDKKWHVAGTGFFDMHQTRSDQDIKVGNFLTVEGGAGRSFLKGAGNAGVAYAMQWKVSDDSGTAVSPVLRGAHNRVYGIGPALQMPVFAKGTLVGLVNVTYLRQFGARANFEGNIFIVGFTLAKLKHIP